MSSSSTSHNMPSQRRHAALEARTVRRRTSVHPGRPRADDTSSASKRTVSAERSTHALPLIVILWYKRDLPPPMTPKLSHRQFKPSRSCRRARQDALGRSAARSGGPRDHRQLDRRRRGILRRARRQPRADVFQRLRHALAEGEASGPAIPFDFDAFLAARRASPSNPDLLPILSTPSPFDPSELPHVVRNERRPERQRRRLLESRTARR